jgi:hypothetical protein
MIITEVTLVGYSVINGTWSIQLGLFVGALLSIIMFPSSELEFENIEFHKDHYLLTAINSTRW